METSEILTTIGLVIALFAAIYSIHTNKIQTKAFNKQLKLNFFTEYTRRYQEIILNLPENINDGDFDFNSLDEDVKNKTLRYMRAYFDLSSEEYDLYKSGYLDKKIWENWEEGIKYAMSKTAFIKAWEIIKLDTIYYSEFTKWMNEILSPKMNS
jgi:hypothetical protein|tara:strand:- start:136 stop:597 length:462 start_codon:yes stop_codon:yes gene_type:complete